MKLRIAEIFVLYVEKYRSGGMFFERHLGKIVLNEKYVNFLAQDLTYLVKVIII